MTFYRVKRYLINKKFEVVIFRYDDDKNDYEEKIKECEV